MKKKLFALFAAVTACICVLAGCTSTKTYEKEGMQITLPSSFYEKELLSQTAYYESSFALVTALKEEFTLMSGLEDYSVADYADMVIRNNMLSAETNEREGKDYLYFTYEKTVSGKEFYYLATTHKSDDAFWLIQFACNASVKDNYTEKFLGWADTVTFVQE